MPEDRPSEDPRLSHNPPERGMDGTEDLTVDKTRGPTMMRELAPKT